jgi:hypothetical protein
MTCELEAIEAVRYRKIQEARRRMAQAGIGRRPETGGEWGLSIEELDELLGDRDGGSSAWRRQARQNWRKGGRYAMDRI